MERQLRQWRMIARCMHLQVVMRLHRVRTSDRDVNSVVDSENHVHRGFYFYGFVVKQVGAVAPCFDGIDCCLLQHGRSADGLEILDCTGLGDGGPQDDGALHTDSLGDDGILRNVLVDEEAFDKSRRQADGRGRWRTNGYNWRMSAEWVQAVAAGSAGTNTDGNVCAKRRRGIVDIADDVRNQSWHHDMSIVQF